jgi:hypothetical protein
LLNLVQGFVAVINTIHVAGDLPRMITVVVSPASQEVAVSSYRCCLFLFHCSHNNTYR